MGMQLDELENVPVEIVILMKCFLEVLEGDLHRRAGELHATVGRSIHRPDEVQASCETRATYHANF